MKTKDFIIIGLLLVVLGAIYKLFSQLKKPISLPDFPEDKTINYSSDEADSPKVIKGRKTRMKQKHKRILKILESSDSPLSISSLLDKYNDKHKNIHKGTIGFFIKWLEKNKYLLSEEVEDLGMVYGLPDWFDNGELNKSYFEKLKSK